MKGDSPTYPIVCLERYENSSQISGVGQNKPMDLACGVALRGEFVRANGKTGTSRTLFGIFTLRSYPEGEQMFLGYY